MDWLEKIKSKPEKERRKFVWMGAALFTFVIFLLWWFVPSPLPKTTPAQVITSTVSSGPSLTELKQNAQKAFNNFGNQFGAVKKSLGF